MHPARIRSVLGLLVVSLALATGCSAPPDAGRSSTSALGGPLVPRFFDVYDRVESARNARDAVGRRVVDELATFGPALTGDAASAAVAAFLAADNGGLAMEQIAAGFGGEETAAALFQGYARLASTPVALSAAAFATRMLDARNGDDPLVQALASYDWQDEVLAPAVPNAAGEALVATGGDVDGALQILVDRLGGLAFAESGQP